MSEETKQTVDRDDNNLLKEEKSNNGLEALFAANCAETRGQTNGDSSDEYQSLVDQGNQRQQAVAEAILNIDVKSKVVEVNNIRLFSLDEIDLDKLTACTFLSLRKNLIHELSPLPEDLAARLVELDLFDNKIRKLRDFFSSVRPTGCQIPVKNKTGAFRNLTKLDLSYNQIREIEGLEPLGPTLKELYLVENKLKEINNLDSLVNLELLELGGNRIREIGSGLAKLTRLKQLWLGKNKITTLGTSLNNLVSIEIISLQANRLTSIEPENFPGSGTNPCLRELYLSENGLTCIQNIGFFPSLLTIDFSFNPISFINTDVINPQRMPLLEEFWLTDGNIATWDEVAKLNGFKKTLKTAYFERNPIEDDKRYRDKVYMYLPFLEQIDSWPVVNKGNLEADRKRKA